VDAWLQLARPRLAPVLDGDVEDPSMPDVAQLNVVNQLAVLRSYPATRRHLDAGRLRLHGWYYEVDTGQVHELDEDGLFRVHAA
jgi:carbonic anhydrase